MKIAYFVHDLNDPAVARRMRMLRLGGAEIRLLGFCRGVAPAVVEGVRPIVLGATSDARLMQRAVAVMRAMVTVYRCRAGVRQVDAIMARQLETLILAALARGLFAPSAGLVFECLDIHRLISTDGLAGRVLRAIEGFLLRRCGALVVSSAAFVHAHFGRRYATLPPVTLLENKVLDTERGDPLPGARQVGPPWRIGWYGNIRCRRSLRLLADLVADRAGQVEVEIRGRVAATAIPDFDAIVAATPGLRFCGPYDRAHDLPVMYGGVHFAWAIDFFEAGGNSDWLLPNRLYEAGLYGAVPIAVAGVETGAWLGRHHAGALLGDDTATSLSGLFADLDTHKYRAFVAAMTCIPESAFVDTAKDCHELVQRIVKSNVTGPEIQGGANGIDRL